MKKVLFLFTFLLSFHFSQSQVLISILLGDKLNTGKIEFGLEAGYNFAQMSNFESSTALRTFNLGFYFDFYLKDQWFLNTGVLVKSTVGLDDLTENDLAILDPDLVYSDTGTYFQRINYFHVPVAIKYKFKNHFYVKLGPQFALRTKAKLIYEGKINNREVEITTFNSDLFTRLEVAVLGGVGYTLKQGKGMNLGVKYFYGLNDILKDSDLSSHNSSLDIYINIPIGREKASKNETSDP